jgi:hypothetical protein
MFANFFQAGNLLNLFFCLLLHSQQEKINARMAELVDALVSNTNEVTLVPVRLRLRVQKLLSAG